MADSENKTVLAEERTDWAEDRTVLALERTFNSSNGFGLGAVGVALGLRAVFSATEPTWAAKAVASLFLTLALFVFVVAWRQACKTRESFSTQDAAAHGRRSFTAITALLVLATLATGAVLWSL
ncbi:MAG: DUF202 domain-containing protein [Pseudomonadota bacterium]